MKFWAAFIAVLAVMLAALGAFAQNQDKPAGPACTAHQDSKATCSATQAKCESSKANLTKGTCTVNGKEVAFDMPAMKYRVGDKTLCCDKMALEAAKGDEKAVKFVVGDKSYDSKAEAMDAYAAVLDGFLKESMSVKYVVGDECVACPMTAKSLAEKNNAKVKYRVASYTFEDQAKADAALARAREAVEKVGKEKGSCSSSCSATAQSGETKSCGSADAKTVAGGEKKACCKDAANTANKDAKSSADARTVASTDAKTDAKSTCCQDAENKVNLAKAKLIAAMQTLAEAAGV